MPIIKSAIKDLRKSAKRRTENRAVRERVRQTMKMMKRLAAEKKTAELKEKMAEAQSLIDKAAKRNVFHRNNAARKKSHLARYLALASAK